MSNQNNLFDQFAAMTRIRRPIAIHPGQEVEFMDPKSGRIRTRTTPITGTDTIRFEITSITANESMQAEAFVTAQPPAIKREEPGSGGYGTVEVQVGYDYEHPEYLRQIQKDRPKRDAAICLFGCPALMDSTPGIDLNSKVEKLTSQLPAGLLEWIAEKINSLAALTAVGEEEVQAFFTRGSESSQDLPNSTDRSQTSGKRKSSSGKTGSTSTTRSAKQRGSTE